MKSSKNLFAHSIHSGWWTLTIHIDHIRMTVEFSKKFPIDFLIKQEAEVCKILWCFISRWISSRSFISRWNPGSYWGILIYFLCHSDWQLTWLLDKQSAISLMALTWWLQPLGWLIHHSIRSLIARVMGPTWGPSGADRTQMGPMLAPWTLLFGMSYHKISQRLKGMRSGVEMLVLPNDLACVSAVMLPRLLPNLKAIENF